MLLHAINPDAGSFSKLGCCTCSESIHGLHSPPWGPNLSAHTFFWIISLLLYLQVPGILRSDPDFA